MGVGSLTAAPSLNFHQNWAWPQGESNPATKRDHTIQYIENNTWVRGNTRFISSVEHDISRVSAANDFHMCDYHE